MAAVGASVALLKRSREKRRAKSKEAKERQANGTCPRRRTPSQSPFVCMSKPHPKRQDQAQSASASEPMRSPPLQQGRQSHIARQSCSNQGFRDKRESVMAAVKSKLQRETATYGSSLQAPYLPDAASITMQLGDQEDVGRKVDSLKWLALSESLDEEIRNTPLPPLCGDHQIQSAAARLCPTTMHVNTRAVQMPPLRSAWLASSKRPKWFCSKSSPEWMYNTEDAIFFHEVKSTLWKVDVSADGVGRVIHRLDAHWKRTLLAFVGGDDGMLVQTCFSSWHACSQVARQKDSSKEILRMARCGICSEHFFHGREQEYRVRRCHTLSTLRAYTLHRMPRKLRHCCC